MRISRFKALCFSHTIGFTGVSDGKHRQEDLITAPLPDGVKRLGGHFDATLQSFILHQYHHCHVTQPLILEQLRELGVDISAGQINRIITEGKERFHKEKDEILRVGLRASTHVNVDDTGARHKGKNGFCTHIGNEMFAWFQSTAVKNRLNFLKLLGAGVDDYCAQYRCAGIYEGSEASQGLH